MQRREIDDEALAEQTAEDGVVEHFVRAFAPERDFAGKDRFG